jgi:cyclase
MKNQKNVVVMPCLDMQNGRVVKGVRFVDIRDAGDPVECCAAYCQAGADEIAMLDITATVEGRATMLDVVKRVAEAATVPFTVGGGISDTCSAAAVLNAGADKISTSSAAFRKPAVIQDMVKEFGAQRVTVAIDAAQNPKLPSGYEVYIDGGRTATGKDAVEWAKAVDGFGVRTILPTSKSTDGVRTGYDLPLIRAIKAVTTADVVASGGAGKLEHFLAAVEAGAAVLLAASVFHFGVIGIGDLKAYLKQHGVPVRLSPPGKSTARRGLRRGVAGADGQR